MKAGLPLAALLAIALILLLSFGPLVTGLDLMFHFLPTRFPAIRDFDLASPMGHALWVGSGFVGVLTVLLLLRRQPGLALVASLAFSMVYVTGAQMVWFRFTFGCWLAIASAGLVVLARRVKS